MSYSPLLTPAPRTLIADDGRVHYGLFDKAVPALNLPAFVLSSEMDKPVGRLRQYFAYKQFQFLVISGEDWLLAVAIADIRFAATGFAYLWRAGEPVKEFGMLRPLSFRSQVSQSSSEGRACIGHKKGKPRWHIDCSPAHWVLSLSAPNLRAELQIAQNAQPAMALCAPTGYAGWTYTMKNNGLPVSGTLQIGRTMLDLSKARAGLDFSAGFMRRETSWRWASINTLLDGQPLGLNLAAGVNETGLCENALWYQGQRQHLSPVTFEFNRGQNERWHISTLCGEVDLQFEPGFCRKEKLGLGLLASNFRQYCGYFSGTIRLSDGRELVLARCLGLAEDHYAKW